MLFIDLWKKIVIWVVVAVGLVLALPNAFYDRVEQFNDAEKAIEVGFDTPENRYKSGLWPSFLPSGLVNLGPDLRGGAHLLAEVKVADVYAQRMTALWPDVRDVLRPERAKALSSAAHKRHPPAPRPTDAHHRANPDPSSPNQRVKTTAKDLFFQDFRGCQAQPQSPFQRH